MQQNKIEYIVNNYINGNLKDFRDSMKKLNKADREIIIKELPINDKIDHNFLQSNLDLI